MDRRRFAALLTSLGASAAVGRFVPRGTVWQDIVPAATASEITSLPQMARYPQKTELILLTDRPPQLETPLHYFQTELTPNEAFFVRWHLSGIPTSVDTRTFRLEVNGNVARPLILSLADLQTKFPAVSVVALCQCAGNARSYFEPQVPGGQWGFGAMSNARWKGVRLKDVLEKAGVLPGSVQVGLRGLDTAPLPQMPRFEKSLPIERAQDGEVIIAYEMNGAPLPMLNGFPLRLVIPGWYATYWVKSLTNITVLDHRFTGFWMATAYHIPATPGANESPQAHAKLTVPINRMNVRSFFVRPDPGARAPAGQAWALEGIAFDGGDGIRQVEFSADGGGNWSATRLGEDLGRFSFRRWHAEWTPSTRGEYGLQVRAVNNAGEGQPTQANWNRGGFMRNVIEEIRVTAS